MKAQSKILYIALAVVVFISPLLLHSVAGIGISPILSGSMRPFANPGDVFVTQSVPAKDLKVGDIISVNSKEFGGVYAHRIQSLENVNGTLSFRTKGDANSAPEVQPFIASLDQSVPKTLFRVPFIGRPLVYLASKPGRSFGYSLLIGANLLAIFAFAFRERRRYISQAESVYKSLYLDEKAKREILEAQYAGKRSYLHNQEDNQEVAL